MMANDRGTDPLTESSGYRDAFVTQLVAGYVDRLNRGTEIDPEEVRREYPDIADEILSQLEVFVGLQAGTAAEDGRTVIGDYVLKRRVGRGGMGVVYDAWQNSLERRVALKVLPVGIAADGKVLQRFMREARTAAKLNHPHIVSVYGMGIEANTPYFAMEFVEGETLAQVIAKRREPAQGETRDEVATPFGRASEGQLYFTRLATAFAAVADGLYHAHTSGVVHRDIKPSNLIFDGENRLRILDFGLAHMEGQESLTHTGDFLGTPVYMSPEQAMAKRIPVDHRTDIYSLGATLYEVLCVRPPFQGKDTADTLSQIILKEPRQLRQLDPRVPRDLETIVLKCLHKDPVDRYGTAEALAQDLRRFVRGEPIEARPQSKFERLKRSAWRHKGRFAVACVCLLLVVAALLLGVNYGRQARAEKEARYASLVRDAVLKRELGRLTREAGGKREDDPFEFMYDTKDSHTHLGRSLLDEARMGLDTALALSPRRSEAYYHRAVVRILLKQYEEAGRDVTECLSRTPGFAPARALRAAFPETAGGGTRESGIDENATAEHTWFLAYKAGREGRWQDAATAYGALMADDAPDRESFLGASIETRIGRGIAYLLHGSYLDAYGDFAAAHALWPEAVAPELLLGMIFLHMNEHDRAAKVFEELCSRELPNTDDVLAAVSCIYRTFHKHPEALAWADRIGQVPRRERSRAHCLINMHRFDEAGEAYAKAMAASPADPQNYGYQYTLTLLAETPTWREKIERLCLADLERNPALAEAWAILAVINETRGADDKARELYLHALRLAPDCASAKHLYARFIGMRGEYAEATRLLEELCKEDRVQLPLLMLGRVHWYQGNYDRACELWRHLVRENPSLWARAQLAIGLAWVGERDEARRLCDEILQSGVEDISAMDLAAWALAGLGELETAASLCRQILTMAPSQNHVREDLGWMYQAQGRPVDAAREYETALAIEPGRNADSYLNLKHAYRRLGRDEEALTACRRGLKYHPDHGDLWRHLGEQLAYMRRSHEACAAAVDFARTVPTDSCAHAVLVDLTRTADLSRASARQWDAALPELERLGEQHPDNAALLHALALGCLRAEAQRDLGKARAAINAADRIVSHGDADVCATKAEVLFQEGDVTQAIALIEEALKSRERDLFFSSRHAAYAEALLPVFVSLRSIDVVLARRSRERDGELLEQFERSTPNARGSLLHRYLEGRIRARAGAFADAAAAFEHLVQNGERSPRVVEALAESLRGAGNPARAELVLKEALRAGARHDRACWYLWLRVVLDDLRKAPAEVLADLPTPPAAGDAPELDLSADVRWLLEALSAGHVRIDCGRDKDLEIDGVAWGKDRFFVGGRRGDAGRPYVLWKGHSPVFESERWFVAEESYGGYTIPLPRGRYEVRVHFMESWYVAPALRRLGMSLEGREVLAGYDPIAAVGYGTPDDREYETSVEDGALEIEFTADIECPFITAIEILPAAP